MAKKPRLFSEVTINQVPLWDLAMAPPRAANLDYVVRVLDFVHIEAGLLSPYSRSYPLVEPRELIPSFLAPYIEYKELPAFSMLILGRNMSYQDEGFQFDMLLPEGSPPDPGIAATNRQTLRERMPRDQLGALEAVLGRKAPTAFARYTLLLPYLMKMDRGHIIAPGPNGRYLLAGVYASFPSDLDGELKRFGYTIGKFLRGDNDIYAQNRQFVYRFLMEQHGFAISGERHTSAALFASRLMRQKEDFAVKVMGHSDRTITTLTSLDAEGRLPRVEKVALVHAGGCSKEGARKLDDGGFLLDKKRRVVILRVHYQQHAYHPSNVLEDRALSVLRQEVIHPHTGQTMELDILGLGRHRLLQLNDIVRGEHLGTISYGGQELLTSTADMDDRLKFITAWIKKHRPILADYSADTFGRVSGIVSSFLDDPEMQEVFQRTPELYNELKSSLAELRLAHRLRLLEKLVANMADASGSRLQHVHVLTILVHALDQEGKDLAQNQPWAMGKLLSICLTQLGKPYLHRRYLSKAPVNEEERRVVVEWRKLSKLVNQYLLNSG